jgi:hypothetical protein
MLGAMYCCKFGMLCGLFCGTSNAPMEYERFVVAVLAVEVVVAGGRDARVVDAVLSMLVSSTL